MRTAVKGLGLGPVEGFGWLTRKWRKRMCTFTNTEKGVLGGLLFLAARFSAFPLEFIKKIYLVVTNLE